MQELTPQLVSGKKVLLRLDIDVPLKEVTVEGGPARGEARQRRQWTVEDDFRLKAGLPTLHLLLENAQSVIIMGHLGRPGGKEVPQLSVAPINKWLLSHGFKDELASQKLRLLENLRFEAGEDDIDLEYAKELEKLGEVFINESFAAYRPSASTTILPTLMPHGAGLRFAHEVEILKGVRENPKKPLVAIVGGAKVEDKLPVVEALAKFADAVLVGGLLPKEIREKNIKVSSNVMLGKLNGSGIDLLHESVDAFIRLIKGAKQIIWNGPVGKYEEEEGIKGTRVLAEAILRSEAETIVGGGDVIAALGKLGLLEKFEQKGLVSTGGGAMLKLLVDGTLPTIDALK